MENSGVRNVEERWFPGRRKRWLTLSSGSVDMCHKQPCRPGLNVPLNEDTITGVLPQCQDVTSGRPAKGRHYWFPGDRRELSAERLLVFFFFLFMYPSLCFCLLPYCSKIKIKTKFFLRYSICLVMLLCAKIKLQRILLETIQRQSMNFYMEMSWVFILMTISVGIK